MWLDDDMTNSTWRVVPHAERNASTFAGILTDLEREYRSTPAEHRDQYQRLLKADGIQEALRRLASAGLIDLP